MPLPCQIEQFRSAAIHLWRDICIQLFSYNMFHVTWTIFKFNRNQLGIACVREQTYDIRVTQANWEQFQRLSWSRCHGVINVPIKSLAKNYSPKNFTVGLRTTSKYWKLYSLKIKIVSQISDEILVLLTAALGFKWNPLWHWMSILNNHQVCT